MAAYLTAAGLDKHSVLTVTPGRSAETERQDPGRSGAFAKALRILSGQGDAAQTAVPAKPRYATAGPADAADYKTALSKVATLPTDGNGTFVGLQHLGRGPTAEDWAALQPQTKAEDFSVLSAIGDGLLTAAKIAGAIIAF